MLEVWRRSNLLSRVVLLSVLCLVVLVLTSPINAYVAVGTSDLPNVNSGTHYRISAVVPGLIYRFSAETKDGKVYGHLWGVEMREFLGYLRMP